MHKRKLPFVPSSNIPLPLSAHTHMAKILGFALPAGLTTDAEMNVGRDGAEHREWVEQIAVRVADHPGAHVALMAEIELFRAANLREDARLAT